MCLFQASRTAGGTRAAKMISARSSGLTRGESLKSWCFTLMVVVLQDVRTSLVFKWKVIFCLVSPFGRLYEEFSESGETAWRGKISSWVLSCDGRTVLLLRTRVRFSGPLIVIQRTGVGVLLVMWLRLFRFDSAKRVFPVFGHSLVMFRIRFGLVYATLTQLKQQRPQKYKKNPLGLK